MKDEIEIFLKSPIAFNGSWSASDSTISALIPGNEGVRINGKIEAPTGVLLAWGKELNRHNRYYYGSSSASITRRKIEGFEENGNEVQFKITQVANFKTPGYRQYFNSDVGKFAEIIQQDQRTMAFLENIPGLEEKFKKYVNETIGWWVHNEQTLAMWREARPNGNPPIQFLQSHYSPMANELCEINDLVTKENMANLEEQLNAVLVIGTEEGDSTYKVETFAKLGIKNGPGSTFLYQSRPRDARENLGPYEDNNLVPVAEDITSIRSWNTDDQNKAKNLKAEYYESSRAAHSDFTVNFRINPETDYKIYARFTWKKIQYAHEKTVTKTRRNDWNGQRRTHYNRNTDYRTIYLPVIDSLCLEILPPKEVGVNPHYTITGLNMQGAGLTTSGTSGFTLTRIQRVRDATKKRASKGGYKGGYQGIESLGVGVTHISFAFIINLLSLILLGHHQFAVTDWRKIEPFH